MLLKTTKKLDCFVTLFLAKTPIILEVLIEKWNKKSASGVVGAVLAKLLPH